MLTPGDLLGDRYRLEERVGGGGMGDVWRATDTVLARRVAIKVLRPEGAAARTFAARFSAEARTMAALRHPGVVEVYDYGDGGDDGGEAAGRGNAYLVMAFVDGEPLSDRIARDGALGPGEAMSIVAQAADALEAAHQAGIVHRDVKPGNLLIRPDGTVVLVDFGVARTTNTATDATALTGINEVVGTALYMAPEQVTKGAITPATDIYALGAVAYHCLAGHPPFMGVNPLSVALSHLNDDPPPLPDGVAPPLVRLVERAMAKDPAERFPSAAALAEAARGAARQAGSGWEGAAAGSTIAFVPGAAAIPAPGGADETSARTEAAAFAAAGGAAAGGAAAGGAAAGGAAANGAATGLAARHATEAAAPAVRGAVASPGGRSAGASAASPADDAAAAKRRRMLIGTGAGVAVLALAAAAVFALANLGDDNGGSNQQPGGPGAPSASVSATRPAGNQGGETGPTRSTGPRATQSATAAPPGNPGQSPGGSEPDPTTAPPEEPDPTQDDEPSTGGGGETGGPTAPAASVEAGVVGSSPDAG